jgi:hypothetical protein
VEREREGIEEGQLEPSALSSLLYGPKREQDEKIIHKHFASYFLQLHLHHFSKINSHKEVTKQ